MRARNLNRVTCWKWLYNRFKQVKITKNVILMLGKKNEHVTVAVPRSLIDEDAEQKLFKLQKLLG